MTKRKNKGKMKTKEGVNEKKKDSRGKRRI